MRLVKFGTGLLFVLVGGITIIVIVARSLQSQSVCLLFDSRDDQGGDVRVIDPRVRKQFRYDHVPPQWPVFPLNGDVSSDDKNAMYLTGPKSGPYSLFIDPIPLKQYDGYIRCFTIEGCWIGEASPHSVARPVTTGIQQHFVATWLDNKQLVYSTPAGNQRQTLVIESPDGTTKYTMPITFRQNDEISLTVLTIPLTFLVNHTDIYVWYVTDGRVVPFPSAMTTQRDFPKLSPRGRYVTFTDQDKFVILSTETRTRTELPLPLPIQKATAGVAGWSRDEQHFILQYVDAASNPRSALYDVDGSKILDVDGRGFWSNDSRIYFLLTSMGQGSSNLIAFHLADGQSETVQEDVTWSQQQYAPDWVPLVWKEKGEQTLGILDLETNKLRGISTGITRIESVQPANNGQTVLYTVVHGDQYSTEVVNKDGKNHIVLFSGPSMGDPLLINAGKSLLYTAEHNGTFDVDTINLDGTDHRVLAAGLDAVFRMGAWKDYHYADAIHESPDLITLVGKRNGGITAEIVVPQLGIHHILADGLKSIDGLTANADIPGVSFYWQNANNDDGVDGFTLDGQRAYHVTFPGQYYGGAYTVYSYSLSPAKHVVAVVEHDPPHLYLMAADGSWTKTLDANPRYSQAWSPDGSQFASVETDNQSGDVNAVILDENGNNLLRITGFSKQGRLSWNHCDY
jgi:hypothetical protein